MLKHESDLYLSVHKRINVTTMVFVDNVLKFLWIIIDICGYFQKLKRLHKWAIDCVQLNFFLEKCRFENKIFFVWK